MNEADVLGRFIPPFGRVVAMMQFNMYHHFTVDEHLIRTVGNLTHIERGGAVEELPLSTRIFSTIQNRRALYVAAFLHDVGKGRDEDHSILGARIAREICPRLGLSAAETETVVWLIEQHLTMSNIAQSRDIADPKTVRDFADIVQSPERLKLLLLLTVADIRAVGPGVWNGWKGQLLRTLYHETEPLLSGGHTEIPRTQLVARGRGRAQGRAVRLAEGRGRPVRRPALPRLLAAHRNKQAGLSCAPAAAHGARAANTWPTDFTTDAFTADHRADGYRAEPCAAVGAVRGCLRRKRRQYSGCAHHDDARWLCTRYVPPGARVRH